LKKIKYNLDDFQTMFKVNSGIFRHDLGAIQTELKGNLENGLSGGRCGDMGVRGDWGLDGVNAD
jgi:hypothetical protein